MTYPDEIFAAIIESVRQENRWLKIALESLYAIQGEWPMPEQGREALEEDLRHMADYQEGPQS